MIPWMLWRSICKGSNVGYCSDGLCFLNGAVWNPNLRGEAGHRGLFIVWHRSRLDSVRWSRGYPGLLYFN